MGAQSAAPLAGTRGQRLISGNGQSITDICELAQLHRPRTREEMKAAVIEMRSRGMSDYGIAAATALSVEQVRRLSGEGRAWARGEVAP